MMNSWVFLSFAIIGILLLAGCGVQSETWGNLSCVTSTERWGVRGDSLKGIAEEGENITIRFGYYACNDVERDDLVVYNWSGNDAPLLKLIKAVPGDNVSLQEDGTGYLIVVNGAPLTTTDGRPYLVGGRKYTMLSLYVNEYVNGIPADTYLLLGNDPAGTMDSTRFGMIDRSDILGKAELAHTE